MKKSILLGREYLMTTKQVSFRIDTTIIKKLKHIAVEKDETLTELFNEAIIDLIKKYENESSEGLKK